MTADIEARLRDHAVSEWGETVQASLEWEAADTIAALKAQLAEAMEALRPWAKLADQYRKAWESRSSQFKDEGFVLPEEKDTERVRLSVFLGQIRRAAEVLRKMEKTNG